MSTPQRALRTCISALTILFLMSVDAVQTADARMLVEVPEDLIAVELATVGMASEGSVPVALLRDPGGGDVVPIFIGVNEARAILMALYEVPVARPMTHDLLGNLLAALDARLERVIVDDLVEGAYLGILELRVGEPERRVLVDSRPSDAMALALRTGAAIFVAPKVLRAAPDLDFQPLEGEEIVSAIGITVVEATDELREAMGLPSDAGVLISAARAAAAEAGLRAGGMVLTVNGEPAISPLTFLNLVRATPRGEAATIGYWQDGERGAVEVPTDVPEPERRPASGEEVHRF